MSKSYGGATFNSYQELSRETAIEGDNQILRYTLGLTGEAGEVAEKIKKTERGDHELDEEAVAKELGDVLWYMARIADEIGYSFNDIQRMNANKLIERMTEDKIQGDGDER
jgi:NTP pyrophosphatase (non-canonical NTP hydrolase)